MSEHPTLDAPSTDAFDEYQRSLACVVMLDEPIWERIRAAYRAGYEAGHANADL